MRLVDDHISQMAEELGPQGMIRQDAGVEHVRVGQQHTGVFTEESAASTRRALRRVAIIGGGQRAHDAVACALGERGPLAELVLSASAPFVG